MNYSQMKTIAQDDLRAASELGFDHLTIAAVQLRHLGVRIAQSAICRENVWHESQLLQVDAMWRQRAALFEIENGKLTRPLRHMRWHDNPFRMLSAVSGMSDEKMLFGKPRHSGASWSPLILAPALRVEGFHFSSVTRF